MTLRVNREVCPEFWVKVKLAYELDSLDGCLCCVLPNDLASGQKDALEVDPEWAQSILSWCEKDVWEIVLFAEEPQALAPYATFDEQTWKTKSFWPSEAPYPVWVTE